MKRKQVASDTQKEVQNPPKKKNEFEKEVEEATTYIVLMPSETRSGRTSQKESSSSFSSNSPSKEDGFS